MANTGIFFSTQIWQVQWLERDNRESSLSHNTIQFAYWNNSNNSENWDPFLHCQLPCSSMILSILDSWYSLIGYFSSIGHNFNQGHEDTTFIQGSKYSHPEIQEVHSTILQYPKGMNLALSPSLNKWFSSNNLSSRKNIYILLTLHHTPRNRKSGMYFPDLLFLKNDFWQWKWAVWCSPWYKSRQGSSP